MRSNQARFHPKRGVLRLLTLCLLCAAMLAACGQGGGDNAETEGSTAPRSTVKLTGSVTESGGRQEPMHVETVPCDLNGDGEEDTVRHELWDLFGGAGQYRTYAFLTAEDGTRQIFDSYAYFSDMDNMGFTCTLSEGGVLWIENPAVGYDTQLVIPREDTVYSFLFDENGAPRENAQSMFLVDGMYSVEARDTDGDGIDSLICYHYTSIGWHANYIGRAVNVLTYDPAKGMFQVTSASFEALPALMP